MEFLVFPSIPSDTADEHWKRVRDVEVHAQSKRGPHPCSPLHEHAEAKAQRQEIEITLAFSENHRERRKCIGLRSNELNSALRKLDGKEDGDASTDDRARNHTHDVSFGDVVGSVSDVQAVLVIPDDGAGHRNG